jgi:hypothetical protein
MSSAARGLESGVGAAISSDVKLRQFAKEHLPVTSFPGLMLRAADAIIPPSSRAAAGQGLQSDAQSRFPVNPRVDAQSGGMAGAAKWMTQTLPEGIGQMAPGLAAGAVNPALGVFTMAGQAGLQQAGPAFDEMLQKTGDPVKAWTAYFLNLGGAGVAFAFPAGKIMGQLSGPAQSMVKSMLVDAGAVGLGNAAASTVHDAVVKELTGEDVPIFENAWKAGLEGLKFGAAVGVGVHGARAGIEALPTEGRLAGKAAEFVQGAKTELPSEKAPEGAEPPKPGAKAQMGEQEAPKFERAKQTISQVTPAGGAEPFGEAAGRLEAVEPTTPEEAQDLAIARKFGRKAFLVSHPDGEPMPVPGLTSEGVTYLDKNSSSSARRRAVLFHELIHGPGWQSIREDVARVDPEGLRAAEDAYTKRNAEMGLPELSPDQVQEEGLAHWTERNWVGIQHEILNPGRLQGFLQAQPSTGERLADMLVRMVRRVPGLSDASRTTAEDRLLAAREVLRTRDGLQDPAKLSEAAQAISRGLKASGMEWAKGEEERTAGFEFGKKVGAQPDVPLLPEAGSIQLPAGRTPAEAEGARVMDEKLGPQVPRLGPARDIQLPAGKPAPPPDELPNEAFPSRFALPPDALGFRSTLEDAAEEKLPERGSALQIIRTLENTPGVKSEEIEWSGLRQFLQGKSSVSKQEVLDYLKQSNVKVEERALGESPTQQGSITDLPNGKFRVSFPSLQDELYGERGLAISRLSSLRRHFGADDTKFSQYQLPGGTNYRELLMTLPKRGADYGLGSPARAVRGAEGWEVYDDAGHKYGVYYAGTEAEALAKARHGGPTDFGISEKRAAMSPDFTGGHYSDTPNVLAHLRVNDRTTADGKKMLFIEEVQSDWHQKGRRGGYANGPGTRSVDAIDREMNALHDEYPPPEEGEPINPEMARRMNALQEERNRAGGAVPDAPFKKTWHELALKRAIRYAAENRYDSVGWTTGEQQAERYDLSKQISKIEWLKSKTGQGVHLTAYDKSGKEVIGDWFKPETIPDTIGKELADKIASNPRESGDFSGVDLKVGGEGMRGFYDKMLPAAAEKIGKVGGARVEDATIGASAKEAGWHIKQRQGGYVVVDERGREYGFYETLGHAQEGLASSLGASPEDVRNGFQVHSLDITPALRESAMQRGFPRFALPEKPSEIPDIREDPEGAKARIEDFYKRRDLLEAEAESRSRQREHDLAAAAKDTGVPEKDWRRAIVRYIDAKQHGEGELDTIGSTLDADQQRIIELAKNLPEPIKKIADQMVETARGHRDQAIASGLIEKGLDYYTAHLWKQPEGEMAPEARGKFGTNTPRAKHRSISIMQGLANGMELKVDDAIAAERIASKQLIQAVTDRNFLNAMKAAGIIKDEPGPGLVALKHPRLRMPPSYADPATAKALNRALGTSVLSDFGPIQKISDFTRAAKSLLLTTSLFHDRAFVTRYMLGAPGAMAANPIEGYRQGGEIIRRFDQHTQDLFAAGMTGPHTNDFGDLKENAGNVLTRQLDKIRMVGDARQFLADMNQRHSDFLFGKLGPHLKTMAALSEYVRLLDKHSDAITAGTVTREEIAKGVATTYNNLFGGQNLKRLGEFGRDPTVQHAFRLLALAPDWTESNLRLWASMFQRGMKGEVARAVMGRAFARAGAAVIGLNLALSTVDDKNAMERYGEAWKQGGLRWMDVDVTPILRAMGREKPERVYFGVVSALRDGIRAADSALESLGLPSLEGAPKTQPNGEPSKERKVGALEGYLSSKGSVLTRAALDFARGYDWQGKGFTSFGELLGIDDKGDYKRAGAGHYIGQEKGGQLAGQLTSYKTESPGVVGPRRFPSYIGAQVRGNSPIPFQSAEAALAGEMDWALALGRSAGLDLKEEHLPPPPKAKAPGSSLSFPTLTLGGNR